MLERIARVDHLALLLLLVALLVRVPHLDWGLPDVEEEALPAKKAFDMWGFDDGRLQLDPRTAGWPSLSFHAHLALQKLQYAVGRLSGRYEDPYDFYVEYRLDLSAVILWARALGVLASLVVVATAVRVGRRIAGSAGAWVAGALLALSPMLVEHAQMVTPDILLTMFAALAVDRILRVAEAGRTRDYVLAAAFCGLGAAAKYTPVILTLSLYLAHLWRRRRESRPLGPLALDDRRIGLAALVAVLSFTLASPYTFADLEVLRRDFAYQALHMKQGHFGHEAQGVGYGYYLGEVLPRGLGVVALLFAAGGIVHGLRRRRDAMIGLVACLLPFFLVLGSLNTHFDRYMLPALLPLALAAAHGVESARRRLAPRGRRWFVPACVLVMLVGPSLRTWAYHGRAAAESTQQAAARWIAENVDPLSTFALERYSPELPEDPRQTVALEPAFARLDADQQARLLDRPHYQFQHIPMYAARVELSAFYYDLRHYLPYDYVVTSGAVRRRYEAAPDKYPRQVAFYRDLETYATTARVFSPGDGLRGPEIRIHRFTPLGKERLLGARGPLPESFYVDWIDRLHAPHFLRFVEFVARHAQWKERYDVAAFYYRALLETAPPEERLDVLELTAYACLRDGDLPRASTYYERLVTARPRSASAVGNLGFVREREGRVGEARELYRRALELDPQGPAGRWAEQRLRSLGADEGQRR